MMDYYEKLKVPTVINAAGKYTLYGGCCTFPKAAQAMAEAASHYVELLHLHKQAGEYIAKLLNVEAAAVTAGASPGMTQATAACIAGMDPYLRSRLPSNPPAKREVIVQRAQRNPYDNALLIAGAKFVEIGDLFKTNPWDLEGAINENTAAIFFDYCTVEIETALTLQEVLPIAHKHGVPVIVDAAPLLPPKSNLWTLAQQGIDLVVFSGGKDMRGPQSSGLIVGRKDLVEAAAFNGAPNYGVGRPMKVSKDNIVGLVAALECYLEEDEEKRFAGWRDVQNEWITGLNGVGGWEARVHEVRTSDLLPLGIPKVDLVPTDCVALSVTELISRLKRGNPSIVVDQNVKGIVLNPSSLEPDEWRIVLKRIREEIS